MSESVRSYPQSQEAEVYPTKSGTDGPWCIAEIAVVEKRLTGRNQMPEVAILRCSRMYGHKGRHLLNLDGARLSATIEWIDTWDTENTSGGRVS